jgi:hypothetical protein
MFDILNGTADWFRAISKLVHSAEVINPRVIDDIVREKESEGIDFIIVRTLVCQVQLCQLQKPFFFLILRAIQALFKFPPYALEDIVPLHFIVMVAGLEILDLGNRLNEAIDV